MVRLAVVDAKNTALTTYLLIGGAVLGLGAAMWSALGIGQALTKYSDAIAVIDGEPISRTVFDSAVEGLASAKRNPLTEAEKRVALERIIDEELLLRRALELGLGASDPTSRKALVNAILQFSIAGAAKREPTQRELEEFYAGRPKLIAPQPLLTVRAVSFAVTDIERARLFKSALDNGQGFDAVVKDAKPEFVLLPNGPVIPAKVAEYAGATVRDTALSLATGHTSGPVEIGNRIVFVHLADRTETPPPPLSTVRDIVLEEWRKREAEQAFADYVASLRSNARISYAPGVPRAEAE
jgi:hypothetical protein